MNNFFRSQGKNLQNNNPANAYYPEPISFKTENDAQQASAQNFSFDNQNNQTDFQNNFSNNDGNFFEKFQNNEQNSQQQSFSSDNHQNGFNIANLMNMLKGNNSNDMLTNILTSGLLNSNPNQKGTAEMLAKLMNNQQKSSKKETDTKHKTTFEEI